MCDKDLEIIKGDTLTLNINVKNGLDLINKMFFSSKVLGIQKEVEYFGENVYQVVISAEETKKFNVSQASYDITVVKKNEHIQTVIYNGYIYIQEKENMLNEY
jgi:hypothetical protein